MIENRTAALRASRTNSGTKSRRGTSSCSSYYSGLVHRVRSKAENADESLTIGVLGCHSGAGVSTVCANFALSCSFDLEQSILLISCHPGDYTLNRILDVKPQQGLNDLVSGDADFESTIASSPKGDLDLIANGLKSRETFSPYIISRFPSILEQAKERYRVVIVDLEPMDHGQGTAALSKALDSVLLVIDGSRTTKESARKAKRTLERAGANLVGTILNR